MRMRTTLLLSLLAVSFGLTALSLIVIHTELKKQIRLTLASDLHRSIATFQNLQQQRREMLSREAGLLADLPSLKALMTVMLRPGPGNDRTVRDGGLEFWKVSGAAFFALAEPTGKVIARYEKGIPPEITEAPEDLRSDFITSPGPHYVLSGTGSMKLSPNHSTLAQPRKAAFWAMLPSVTLSTIESLGKWVRRLLLRWFSTPTMRWSLPHWTQREARNSRDASRAFSMTRWTVRMFG